MTDFLDQVLQLSPKRLALLALELHDELEAVRQAQTEPIAIVGIGCRFPGGAGNPDAFWQVLRDGIDTIDVVPTDRFAVDRYYDPDPDAPGKLYSRYGAFVSGVDRFDAPFFGIAPREAAGMDPQQRLVLEVAWEALEHAGQSPQSLAGTRTGVFVGTCTYDYALLNLANPDRIERHTSSGAAPSILANRVSYTFDFQGPSLTLDTACSSSLVSTHIACRSLRQRECDYALAGGVNLILSPSSSIALSKGRMLAIDGRCKTFDASADGYVRGEGCGIVVLMRLSDAVANNHTIYSVIRGSAVNQDGYGNGLTAPNLRAQQAVIRQALDDARVRPEQIGYVETHGTGTSLGDPIEVDALRAVYGSGRVGDRHCALGSVKTNIGHLEGAAGIAGLIKAVLALQHDAVPPNLHFKRLNPNIALEETPFFIPTELRDWTSCEEPRYAAVSSFGFGGTNAHVILSDPPQPAPADTKPERPLHILTLSAKSDAALDDLAGRYHDYLRETADTISDVCFTANAGRAHHEHRLAVVCDSARSARDGLAGFARGASAAAVLHSASRVTSGNRVAFLFTGQGAQYPGMGRRLYDTEPVVRGMLDRCDELARPYLEHSLLSVLFDDREAGSSLDDTAHAQPALFAVAVALVELWTSWGIVPAAVLGHSLGEYAAAYVAGVFGLEDGMKMVAERGRLMQSLAANGAMAAVFAGEREIVDVIADLHGEVSIATLNGPMETIISGTEDGVDGAAARLRDKGIKSRRLQSSRAFHSRLMDPALDALETLAGSIDLEEPRVTMVSNLTGKAVEAGAVTRARYWRRQARDTVRFADGVRTLHAMGYRNFVEIGPQPALLPSARRSVPNGDGTWIPSLRQGRDDWQQMLTSLGELYVTGCTVDWHGFDAKYRRRRISLPTYPFDRQTYPVNSGDTAGVSDMLYELQWERKPLEGRPTAPGGGRWLIVGGESWRAAAVVRELEAYGETCVVTADLDVLAADEWRGVVRFCQTSDMSIPEAALADCTGVLRLVQQCQTVGISVRLWLISVEDLATDGLAHAPLTGLARTIAVEHPELYVTTLRADAGAAPQSLAAELLTGEEDDQIRWDGETRSVARLARMPYPVPVEDHPVRADGTYLITGGLGALGSQVARSLVAQGARHLVLLGRRPATDGMPALVTELGQAGAKVEVVQADVANVDAMKEVLGRIQETRPPLRGVVHAAGVLDDGILLRQTPERFAAVFAPKVAGAWNLHLLTQNLPLDFVLYFSSMSAVLGAAGQGNYAAANSFLDALAHYRRTRGLPAMSINWGPWDTAGMAASVDARQERRRETHGIRTIASVDARRVLDALLLAAPPQVGVFDVRWPQFLEQFDGAGVPPFLGNFASRRRHQSPVVLFREHLLQSPTGRWGDLALAFVSDHVIRVMGLKPEFALDPERSLRDIGLDSLMVVELARALDIAAPDVFAHPTVAALGELVLNGAHPAAGDLGPASREEAQRDRLLSDVRDLSDAELEALLLDDAGSKDGVV